MSNRFWTPSLTFRSNSQKINQDMLQSRVYVLPFALLVLGIPFGVAIHNVLSVFFLFMVLRLPILSNKLSSSQKSVIILPAVAALWIMAATLINSNNPENRTYEYIFGFLPIVLLPFLAIQRVKLTVEWYKPIRALGLSLSIFMALIVISQYKWGWSLRNPTGGVDFRPFGFVSHPLTLAYTALLVWPWALKEVFTRPKTWHGWIFLISIGIILVLGQSKACQSLAYGLLLWNLIVKLRGKLRFSILALLVLGAVVIFSTDNPVSKRFSYLISETNPDRLSSYPVDRLAFWHAHWKMIEERPILGHGMHLRANYREPYYQAIGLGNFIKNYEAHNQYLQLWANGGLIALSAFLLWLLFLRRVVVSLPSKIKSPFSQSLCLLILGSLFQNAYYDSEVRNLLMVAIVGIFAYINGRENTQSLNLA